MASASDDASPGDLVTDSGPGAADAGDGEPPARPPAAPPWRLLFGIGAVVLVIDQVTKAWAASQLDGGRTIELFWTAQFRLVRNDGAAFSFGSGLTQFIAVAAIAITAAVIWFARGLGDQPKVVGALGLVLGGAVGNIIDRLFRSGDGFLGGHVVDFIDFQWYPVFNVADIGVVCGGILVVLLYRNLAPTPEPESD